MIKKSLMLLLLLFVVYSCQSNYTLSENNIGVSRTLDETKDNGFYVKSLYPRTKILNLDTLGELKVEEVFIEKKWRSKTDLSKVPLDSWNLIIKTSSEIPNNYGFNWKMINEKGNSFWQYEDCVLVSTIYELDTIEDMFELTIYMGDVFYLDTLKKDYKIEKLYLTEKK